MGSSTFTWEYQLNSEIKVVQQLYPCGLDDLSDSLDDLSDSRGWKSWSVTCRKGYFCPVLLDWLFNYEVVILFLSQEIQQIAVVVGFLLLLHGKSGDDFARFPPISKMEGWSLAVIGPHVWTVSITDVLIICRYTTNTQNTQQIPLTYQICSRRTPEGPAKAKRWWDFRYDVASV